MQFRSLSSLLAVACVIGGSALTVRNAAISLANSGSPQLAHAVGGVPAAAEMSDLLEQVGGRPSPLSPEQRGNVGSALARAPLNGTTYLLLGQSAAAEGKRTEARQLVQAAVKRDPRLVAAWLWLLHDYAASGNFKDAAKAGVSAINLRTQEKSALDALVLITNAPEAQPVILEALKRNPTWRSTYLRQLGAGGFDRAFIYNAMGGGTPSVNIKGERTQLLNQLIKDGEFDRAYASWLSWLSGDELSAVDHIYDGNFRAKTGSPPFAWSFTQNATGSAHPSDEGLEVSVDGTSAGVVASQLLVLVPGQYRLVTMLRSTNGEKVASGTPLIWTLKCASTDATLTEAAVPLDRAPIRIAGSVFNVPGDCPAQNLTLTSKAMEYPARVLATLQSVKIETVK